MIKFLKLKYLCLVVILLFCVSCLTKKVWNQSYKENFNQFLISQNGKMVVFLGSKYHYIFHDNSKTLERLLKWPNRRNLFINTQETKFKLSKRNIVTGYVTVESFYNTMPAQDHEFLRALGFRRKDKYLAPKIKLMMKGKRYLPRADLGYNIPQFQRSYMIPIYYKGDTIDNIKKVAITPITIAADSTFIIGKIILSPFRGQ